MALGPRGTLVSGTAPAVKKWWYNGHKMGIKGYHYLSAPVQSNSFFFSLNSVSILQRFLFGRPDPIFQFPVSRRKLFNEFTQIPWPKFQIPATRTKSVLKLLPELDNMFQVAMPQGLLLKTVLSSWPKLEPKSTGKPKGRASSTCGHSGRVGWTWIPPKQPQPMFNHGCHTTSSVNGTGIPFQTAEISISASAVYPLEKIGPSGQTYQKQPVFRWSNHI